LILETKGHDNLAEVKAQAVKRWIDAVNADGRYGSWEYVMGRKVGDMVRAIDAAGAAAPAAA
jgi:type III restriction enzyme